MKLKVKHWWLGFIPVVLVIAIWLGTIVVLVEPLQLKYANNYAESPSNFLLGLAAIVLGTLCAFLTALSQGLLGVKYDSEDPETLVDPNFKGLKSAAFLKWAALWIVVGFILPMIVWKSQL